MAVAHLAQCSMQFGTQCHADPKEGGYTARLRWIMGRGNTTVRSQSPQFHYALTIMSMADITPANVRKLISQ